MIFNLLHKRKLISWLFWILSLLIVSLNVLPINGDNSTLNNNEIVSIRLDYIAHFFVLLPWLFILRFYTGISFQKSPAKGFLIILLSLSFAASLELVQYFLPYRAYNINDLLANGLGVILGMVFFIK